MASQTQSDHERHRSRSHDAVIHVYDRAGNVIETPGLIPVEPPSPIVVQSSPDTRPVSYMLGKQVRFVDTDGRAIDPHMVRAGTRVELGFDRTGRVSRVIAVGPGYYGYPIMDTGIIPTDITGARHTPGITGIEFTIIIIITTIPIKLAE